MSENLDTTPDMEFEFSEETLEVEVPEEIVEVDMSFGANLAMSIEDTILTDIGSARQDALQNL